MASEKCENCKVELQEYEVENGKCNICQSYNNTSVKPERDTVETLDSETHEEENIKPKKGKK